MHVELAAVERPLVDPQLRRMTLDIGERDPGGLLHDVAQLAGEHQPAFAGHRRRFDEKYVPADSGYRETRRHTRHRGPRRRFVIDLGPAQRFPHGRGIYGHRR